MQDRIGFGCEGLQLKDMSAYASGDACTADWCNLFNQYTGKVPLELQTLTQSNPSGAGPTGSLLDLLPFAVQRHATIIELYWQDWLIAFDPSYPGYDVAYAPAFQSAAEGMGQ